MIRPERRQAMTRRQWLLSGLSASALVLARPRESRADDLSLLFIYGWGWILRLGLAFTDLQAKVKSQSGRKTQSEFQVELDGSNLGNKTKIYVYWYSTIFNEATLLGTMKVNKNGDASAKFRVKRRAIETDEICLSLVSDPDPSEIIALGTLGPEEV